MMIFKIPMFLFPVIIWFGTQKQPDKNICTSAQTKAGSSDQNENRFPVHLNTINDFANQCYQKTVANNRKIA